MKRLNSETWKNIFRNLEEKGKEVEVIYLDNVDDSEEWGLCHGCELFEDGFITEVEAYDRLKHLQKTLL